MTDYEVHHNQLKGKKNEIKAELNNKKKEKRKEAMNVRKDISSLFLDVVNYMQTDNLDLKKLMDFYLMNCIMSQLDMATWLSIAL